MQDGGAPRAQWSPRGRTVGRLGRCPRGRAPSSQPLGVLVARAQPTPHSPPEPLLPDLPPNLPASPPSLGRGQPSPLLFTSVARGWAAGGLGGLATGGRLESHNNPRRAYKLLHPPGPITGQGAPRSRGRRPPGAAHAVRAGCGRFASWGEKGPQSPRRALGRWAPGRRADALPARSHRRARGSPQNRCPGSSGLTWQEEHAGLPVGSRAGGQKGGHRKPHEFLSTGPLHPSVKVF